MTASEAARRTMVDCQLRTFDIQDRAVLAAMAEVPRERFVPPDVAALAYADMNIALPGGPSDPRSVLAPMVLARMLQALEVQAGDRALDVAGGYGYASAVFVALGAKPVCLDDREEFSAAARAALPSDVTVETGPLADGAAERGPFNCILINGAVDQRPEALLRQLADGGRLVCLSNEGSAGRALVYLRSGDAFGFRSIFDAVAPTLASFQKAPAFVF